VKPQDQEDAPAENPVGAARTKKKRKGFFAIDMDCFERAGKLGLVPAAAYLALLAGTEKSNTVSSWGIHAISESTGLTRHEAKQAVAALIRAGLMVELEAARTRARTKPRYRLPMTEKRPALAPKERAALEAIKSGGTPDTQAAYRAAGKGWIEKINGTWAEIPANPNVAFVPNSFVRTNTGMSPLARLLNTGEASPLLLALRLYGRQNLMEARGVPIENVKQHYRAHISQQFGGHPYRFVALAPGRIWEGEEGSFDKSGIPGHFNLANDDFWAALRVLEHSHVVEWAVYTANGKPADKYATGRPVRPVGVVRNGVIQVAAPESGAGKLSHAIFCAHDNPMAAPEEIEQHWQRQGFLTAIEHASVPHIEGIGILRMTHRADTDNAKAWWQQINEESREAIFFYRSVAAALGIQLPDLANVPPLRAAAA
jgi:hypothetical protein